MERDGGQCTCVRDGVLTTTMHASQALGHSPEKPTSLYSTMQPTHSVATFSVFGSHTITASQMVLIGFNLVYRRSVYTQQP